MTPVQIHPQNNGIKVMNTVAKKTDINIIIGKISQIYSNFCSVVTSIGTLNLKLL